MRDALAHTIQPSAEGETAGAMGHATERERRRARPLMAALPPALASIDPA